MLILLFKETSWPANVAYLNHIMSISFIYFYTYTFLWVTLCLVFLSHTHSGSASLIWHDKYIISCRLQWMPLKLESFSHENNMLTRDCDIILWVCAWLWCLCLRRWQQESAQNRQDVRLTGQSPIWAGHARNWPIPITGRSIGASLITLHVPRNRNTQYRLKHQRSIPLWECACEIYGL